MEIELHKMSISSEKLKALPAFDRYVFALVGHVFNDLMISQKLLQVSQTPLDAHPFEQDTGVGMSLYMLRILSGRTREAMEALGAQQVENHLLTQYFCRVDGLVERWGNAVTRFRQLDGAWLQRIRNQHAFHYMSYGQWEPFLKDEMCEDGHVIVGSGYGDTFFTWADQVAGYAMLMKVDPDRPFEGLGRMIDELGTLLGDLGDCLARGAQRYMLERLTDDNALSKPERLTAPAYGSFRLPYLFAFEQK